MVSNDAFTEALQKGPLFAALVAFVGGLLTSLTPCVYPMIAITVSVFGARQTKSRREAFALSTFFVLGISVLFTIMLVLAALTGSVFGSVLANRWVNIGLAGIFLVLAFSMFGAFEMTLPHSITQRLSKVGGKGYGGAFLLGLVLSLIAVPCTGPVLTGILLWIAKTKNVGLGSLVGFCFSVGLGIPFWLVGTFAVSLPKGGRWMNWVKSFFGIVLLVMVLYFLKNPFPQIVQPAQNSFIRIIVFGSLIVIGIMVGAIHLSWESSLFQNIRKGVGILITTTSIFLFWMSLSASKDSLEWEPSEELAVEKASIEGRPLIIDFTADWCTACKKMAKDTFGDPRVIKQARRFVPVRIDISSEENPLVKMLTKKYRVTGLPTVVLFDQNGFEKKRINDFVPPEEFLVELNKIE